MKPSTFFYIVIIIVFVFTIIPGMGLCELKTLDDTELSKVEAQSGISNNEKGAKTYGNANGSSECIPGEDGLCDVNNASACSTGTDCFGNDPLAANYPNPTQTYYINQAPTCSSGGCGK